MPIIIPETMKSQGTSVKTRIAAVPLLVVALLVASCVGEAKRLADHSPPDMHSLAVGPEPQVVFFGAHNGLLRSDDAGRSWRAVPVARGDAMGQAAAGERRIVAGHDVYYESDSGGATWREARPALPGTDIHAIATDPASNDFYAFVVGFGLYRSSDGRAWHEVSASIPEATIALAVTRRDGASRILSAGTHGVVASDDDGRTWTRVEGLGAAPSLSVVSRSPSVVYAVSLGALYRSEDGGRAWSALTSAPRGAFLVAASADGEWLYVVTSEKQVWRSENAGTSWSRADG